MADKVDVNIDVASLAEVDASVLQGLRVGQRLTMTRHGDEVAPSFATEAGVRLAPLPDTNVANRFLPNPKVIIRAIKRETGSGGVQQLQVRIYRDDGTGGGGACSADGSAVPQQGPFPAGAGPSANGEASGISEEEAEYRLRQSQYQALADNAELRNMLADPQLQAALTRIDSAPDREKALTAQMESPSFQGFVSQVLRGLDPDRVPATAATAAAVAMGAR